MSETNELVQRYLAAWNETDAAARRAVLAEVAAEDVVIGDDGRISRVLGFLDKVPAGV